MLDQLRARHESLPSPKEIDREVAALCLPLARMGVFNMLMSDGRSLYAFCGKKLSCLTRRAPFGQATLIDEDRKVNFAEETGPNDCVTVVATGPADQRRDLDRHQAGHLLALRDGRGRRLDFFRTARPQEAAATRQKSLMLIDGKPTTAIWPDPGGEGVYILDQTRLPHVVATVLLRDLDDAARGDQGHGRARRAADRRDRRLWPRAGAARGRLRRDAALERAYSASLRSRPTAVNLRHALDDVRARRLAAAGASAGGRRLASRRRNLRRGRRALPARSARPGCR